MSHNITWDDESVKAYEKSTYDKTKKLTFKTGETKRIFVIETQPAAAWQHFVGASVICQKEERGTCQICDSVKPASQKVAANVIVYTTNRDGEFTSNPPKWNLMFWTMSAKKFQELKQIKKVVGSLQDVDLLITCTDETFQNTSIIPVPKSAYATNPELKKEIDEYYEANRYEPIELLGKKYTVAEEANLLAGKWADGKPRKDYSGAAPAASTATPERREVVTATGAGADGNVTKQTLTTPSLDMNELL